MMPDFISLCLIWLFIGSTIWAINDPVRHADFVTRAYVQRNGCLPSRAVMAASVIYVIVLWPRVARAMWWRA